MRSKLIIFLISLSSLGGRAFSQSIEHISQLEAQAQVYFDALKTGIVPDTLTPSFDQIKQSLTEVNVPELQSIPDKDITQVVINMEKQLKSDITAARRQLTNMGLDLSSLVFERTMYNIDLHKKDVFEWPRAHLQILFYQKNDTSLYQLSLKYLVLMDQRWLLTGNLLAATQQKELIKCRFPNLDPTCQNTGKHFRSLRDLHRNDYAYLELLSNEILASKWIIEDPDKIYPSSFSPSEYKLPEVDNSLIDEENPAQIEFEIREFDFGTIEQGSVIEHTFKFKNTGKSPLKIFDARATCGCTLPHYSQDIIEPGEQGEIKVVFDSVGKLGQIKKAITISANTYPESNHKIYIKGEVIE